MNDRELAKAGVDSVIFPPQYCLDWLVKPHWMCVLMEILDVLYSHITWVISCGFKCFKAYKVMSLKSWCSNNTTKKVLYNIGVPDATAAFVDHRIRRRGFELRLNQSGCLVWRSCSDVTPPCCGSLVVSPGAAPRSSEVLQDTE